MSQKKIYKITGMFVILGMLCLIGIILKYGSNRFSGDDNDLVVMYFEESIRGLSVGSPVLFKGVQIGKVAKIHLVADLENNTFKTRVYAMFDFKADIKVLHNSDEYDEHLLENLIADGLKARLITANYLTGQLMVELVMDPDEPVVMRGIGKYEEIPTEFSSFAMISRDLQEIPLRESLARFGSILGTMDQNLPTILQNMSQITGKLDSIMEKKNSETTKTINNFNNALEEIAKASRSMKNLTDYLERHPEALVRGKEK